MEKFPKTEKGPETPEKEYFNLLASYDEKFREIKKMERRIPAGAADEESRRLVSFADKERNEIHNKLKAVGVKLGKSDMDVMIDILRQEGSLAEYGLPEFFVLDANDMKSYGFNLNLDLRRPQKMTADREGFRDAKIDPSSVVIPYVIKPQWYDSGYEGGYLAPKDFALREERAHELAKAASLKIVDEVDFEYFHDSSVSILGVVVPKDRLQEVVHTIRNNPEKFRVGDDFYSDKEKKKILETYQKMIEGDLRWGGKEHAKEYWDARKRYYGEKSPALDPEVLLKKINEELEVVDPIHNKPLKKLPEAIEGTEVLRNKIIAMIDDDEATFETFIPPLLVATNGKAIFIPHGGQSVQELADEIGVTEADIALLDYHLSMGIDGAEVAKKLIKNGFQGTVIGFSSDRSAAGKFKQAGALGALDKNTDKPEVAIKKLATLVSK